MENLLACDYHFLSHQGIQTLHPYVPGKSIAELARERGLSDIIKMASNENPLGCSYLVKESLAALSGSTIASYPAVTIHPLRSKLAKRLDLEEAMLMFSNGTDFLFSVLLMTFALHRNKGILTHEFAFSSYAIQAQTLGIPVASSPLDNWQVNIEDLCARCNNDIAMLFLANPNNPTGTFIEPERIKLLLQTVPENVIVVLDEAYYEYAYPPNDPGALSFLAQHKNLVVTRTFSKAYGLAGLRLGYAIADPAIINLLLRVQLPFAVNQAALEAGSAALDDEHFLSRTLEMNQLGMQQLKRGFTQLGLPYLPSSCNFLTIDCGKPALPVYESLLNQGIIVRPLHAYNLPHHLRISVGTIEQNARLLAGLTKSLEEY